MHITSKAILITQCLQNDFVQPLGPQDALPNRLHIGFSEARRLMGDDPAQGPVAKVMSWACRQPREDLLLVHVRDLHASDDPRQRTHLEQFGRHCISGTPGADLAFAVAANRLNEPEEIQSLTLNDFQDTRLAEVLAPYASTSVPVGLVGVWTEAKILFLAYELATRYPRLRLAVCSALTASSTREGHFLALAQLSRLLGVRVIDSVGLFQEFLGGAREEPPEPGFDRVSPAIALAGEGSLDPGDEQLLRYVFRHCRRVEARLLGGGFSGNVVAGTRSFDLHGHEEASHVVKIGERAAIARERTSFERIEQVLGNHAPRITDFADFGERGIVKYSYASMSGTKAATFQKLYCAQAPPDRVARVLTAVFEEQLGRLYGAATAESCNLLEYYLFDPSRAAGVRRRVEAVLGTAAPLKQIEIGGRDCYNPCRLYEDALPRFDPLRRHAVPFAFVHGDLNGANIVVDDAGNVWLIDFFHTHRGHVLRDLIKLENDLLYIFTPLQDEAALAAALDITDRLVDLERLDELPQAPRERASAEPLARAWETIRVLRGFYPRLVRENHDPYQWHVAALRYALHTLSFDESSPLQKRWALYTAGRCAERIEQRH